MVVFADDFSRRETDTSSRSGCGIGQPMAKALMACRSTWGFGGLGGKPGANRSRDGCFRLDGVGESGRFPFLNFLRVSISTINPRIQSELAGTGPVVGNGDRRPEDRPSPPSPELALAVSTGEHAIGRGWCCSRTLGFEWRSDGRYFDRLIARWGIERSVLPVPPTP